MRTAPVFTTRDIKPQNILFDAEIDEETGKITINPLICGFGAAKIREIKLPTQMRRLFD